MDKFLKQISEEDFRRQKKSRMKGLKQVTIASLPGVLDLNRIIVIKEQLQCKNKCVSDIVDLLREIQNMHIKSVHILTETGIGKSVGPLRRHSDEIVSKMAKELVEGWKVIIANLPVAPVITKTRTPNQLPVLLQDVSSMSNKVRSKAVTLIQQNMKNSDLDTAKLIEKEIFLDGNMKTDSNYKQKIRQKIFSLKKDNKSIPSMASDAQAS